MLDEPASALALWALFDAGGPRPEYVLPVLWAESGFDSGIQNAAGAAQYGLNQASPTLISAYAGTDPATYVTWPASQQIGTVVRGFVLDLVRQYGPLRSATRLEQGNILPASLATAKTLSSAVMTFGDPYYSGNHNLDTANKGVVTVADLAAFVRAAAATPNVQAAIATTYQQRPGERPRDPVLGEDFGSNLGGAALALGAGFLIFAAVRR